MDNQQEQVLDSSREQKHVIPNGELDLDKQYIVTFEEHTEVLVDIKEAT